MFTKRTAVVAAALAALGLAPGAPAHQKQPVEAKRADAEPAKRTVKHQKRKAPAVRRFET